MPDHVADQAIEAFFAGCKEYDIYELASIFPNLSVDDIISIQNDVTDEYNADPEGTLNNNTSGVNTPDNPNTDTEGEFQGNTAATDTEGVFPGNTNTNNSVPNNVQNTSMAGSFDPFWANQNGEKS